MSAASPAESHRLYDSEKDFDFAKPSGLPIRRKRAIDTSKLEDQPPSASSRKENRESLDVFACVGVVYFIRKHIMKLKDIYEEFNNVFENGKDADFTVNIAKVMAAKLNNTALDKLIEEWAQLEDVWQVMVQGYMASYPDVKKASARYMSATSCFLSVWEIKNKVLDLLIMRLQRLLSTIKKTSDSSEIKAYKNRAIQTLSFEDEVSTQIVSQQEALMTLTMMLFKATHRMDPCGKLRKEWAFLREVRNKVKSFMLKLNVDFEKELELARETCGDDVSANNTLKELCMIIRRWTEEYNVVLRMAVTYFLASSKSELKVDNYFTHYLVYRIAKREGTPKAVFTILKLLCQRGTGSSFPEYLRAEHEGSEPQEIRTAIGEFQKQRDLWSLLDAVKFAEENSADCDLWLHLDTKIKDGLNTGKEKEGTSSLSKKLL